MSSDHTQSYVKLCNVVATFHKTLICGTFFSEKIDSSLWAEENGIFALLLLLFISLLALLIMAFVEVVMCVREVVSGATDAANIILPRCPNAHPWCEALSSSSSSLPSMAATLMPRTGLWQSVVQCSFIPNIFYKLKLSSKTLGVITMICMHDNARKCNF